MSQQNRLVIFDTTMRDGEQSPGASMTKEEKVRIGKALEKMRVDVMEAGFAAASPGDFAAIEAVASAVRESTVCSLARAVDRDIEQAAAALKNAERARIHTFIATSPIHMQYKLRMEPNAVIEQAVRAVKKARGLVEDVEFSCEDAGRSEIDFLCRIIEAAIDAGASTINIPDTVGYAIPEEFGNTIRTLIERIPNADKAIFSVHCHNDLGLAVANSLAAVTNGARQVECTINGLGERAGNASLEEVVMATRTRQDLFNIETGIDTTHIVPTSRLVSSITGFPVQPNKAIVGANAFAHESGIVMGKHSGRAAFRSRLQELGVTFETDAALNDAFARFKDLADKKHEIFDEDLQALVTESRSASLPDTYSLVSLESHSATGETPVSEIVISKEGTEHRSKAEGSGPVDAALRAIEEVAKSGANLLLYSVNAITEGTDSQGEVTVRLEKAGRIVNGSGADTDIVVASAKAYIHALNLLVSTNDRTHPQNDGV